MANARNIIDPLLNVFKYVPPALTLGLMVFMAILFVVGTIFPSMNENLKLQSSMLTSLERMFLP